MTKLTICDGCQQPVRIDFTRLFLWRPGEEFAPGDVGGSEPYDLCRTCQYELVKRLRELSHQTVGHN